MFIPDEKACERASKLIKELAGALYEFRIQIDANISFSIEYWGRSEQRDVCHFKLIQQPGCCGILISTDTWVDENHRGQGLAKSMMILKDALAIEFGYSCLSATVNLSGKYAGAEEHILLTHGWQKSGEFVNTRTGNTVGIFYKDLNKEVK